MKPSATAAPRIPDLSLHSVLDISVWNINGGVGGRPLDPAAMWEEDSMLSDGFLPCSLLRALHLRRPGGPPHVKLAIEWDSCVKERLFGSLPEEQVQDADSVWQQQQAHQQHSCTLDECFQFYTKEEQLAQDNAWKCPHCKVLQQGTVKLSLWTLPDILIIHFKRFCQVGERRNKLFTLVKFPLCGLNMAPHVAQRNAGPKPGPGPWPSWKQPACLPTSYPLDFLYDLYAVCNHHGSLQGGHYTAYCRNSVDGQWYSYDDSTVDSLLEDEVITRGAYILFYQKRNSIPSWSASSSMRGSTSSSLSDHWLMRLGSNNGSMRGNLWSWSSSPSPSRPQVPYPPVFTKNRSRKEEANATFSAKREESGQASERVLAEVSCPSGHPNHSAGTGIAGSLNTARKPKDNARQDIRLPRQFDLPLTVMPSMENEKGAQPEGQKATDRKGSGQAGRGSRAPSPGEASQAAALSRSSGDAHRHPSAKVRANAQGGDSETDRFSQGTFTLLRSVFWKKNKKHDRGAADPQVSPVSLGSGRLSPAVAEQARGLSPSLRIPDSLARGSASRLEGAVQSTPSSVHLPRKASRPTRTSALSMSQRSVPREQTSFSPLQKVKYHTLSLGRKKTLPESSF
ncbi:PREDICTED: ubiquitin carboxyl-terminal hydrolase 43-like [Hipposideros armiger]|uniref:ubiquitinyl hydrolase 1 n=1 Tax=Hipposideros armiger TaxID=186990 RepID=A0A8B7QR02_HIPAR|nr:PREDICTED: ubiquitin carboxyl-terminal hydrolase 43-like [Hipposideros armiger]